MSFLVCKDAGAADQMKCVLVGAVLSCNCSYVLASICSAYGFYSYNCERSNEAVPENDMTTIAVGERGEETKILLY